MYYSSGLEYIIGSSYSNNSYSNVQYFSKNTDDNYGFAGNDSIVFEVQYRGKSSALPYNKNENSYISAYSISHSFSPEFFLKPSRPKTRFIVADSEIRNFVEEAFELMMKEKLPSILISVLPFDDFKTAHSGFGAWSNGILGFSINGDNKRIFVRENHLDALMLVIGHEIGHVLTETLPNRHDEEAKAFAFSVEWANTIKKHNIANLGLSLKDEPDFQPARNGLHDVALSFVSFMVKKGRKAMELHRDLAKQYASMFNRIYHPK